MKNSTRSAEQWSALAPLSLQPACPIVLIVSGPRTGPLFCAGPHGCYISLASLSPNTSPSFHRWATDSERGDVPKVTGPGSYGGPCSFQGPEMGRWVGVGLAGCGMRARYQGNPGAVSQDPYQALWGQGKRGNRKEEKFY